MARDASAFIRQAVVGRLKAAAALEGAPVPAERIWSQRAPATAPYEKLQYGQPVTGVFTAGCLDGSRTTFAVHSFAETTGTGAETIGGERRAHDLVAWAAAVLGGNDESGLTLDLAAESDCPFPATAFLEWTGSQVFSDGGADAFHGVATFVATVTS